LNDGLGAVPPRLTFERMGMELKKLKALAEDVLGWKSCNQAWLDHSEDEPSAMVGHISEDGETYPVATIDCDQYYAAQDSLKLAKFYAAANPEMVLRMIAMIEAPN
jgi:hypothetical protein